MAKHDLIAAGDGNRRDQFVLSAAQKLQLRRRGGAAAGLVERLALKGEHLIRAQNESRMIGRYRKRLRLGERRGLFARRAALRAQIPFHGLFIERGFFHHERHARAV